jgi:hypothetical protein
VGFRCIIPPRHLSQLKTRAIPLTWPKVGKNFAVLDIFFMGYLQISTLIFEKKMWRGIFINIP